MTAKERAIQMIEPYVSRGDSLESLVKGHMGSCSPKGYDINIGGYCFTDFGTDKVKSYKLKSGEIGVVLNGSYFEKFKVKDLYNEIVSGMKQLEFF